MAMMPSEHGKSCLSGRVAVSVDTHTSMQARYLQAPKCESLVALNPKFKKNPENKSN